MIHHGVSLDPDCMTLSIGFRAPDAGALLEGALETLDRQSNIPRFNDAGRQHHGQPAEILASDLLEAKAAMIRYLEQPEILEHLLATRVTTPYLDLDTHQEISDEDIDQQIESVTQWELDPGCRMAYVNQTLYINGERIGDQTPSELLHLANTRTVQSADIRKLQGLWRNTIIELIRTESLLPTEDDGS
jgi:50S ribosomal protein L16 3-hydroxylase